LRQLLLSSTQRLTGGKRAPDVIVAVYPIRLYLKSVAIALLLQFTLSFLLFEFVRLRFSLRHQYDGSQEADLRETRYEQL